MKGFLLGLFQKWEEFAKFVNCWQQISFDPVVVSESFFLLFNYDTDNNINKGVRFSDLGEDWDTKK